MKKTFAEDRERWRLWLEENHRTEQEVWLVFYKKHVAKPSITYPESVEEAICFGWIDGLKKRIDDATYAYRFTPRKKKSKWSPLNIEIARRMAEAGKMTEAGLDAYNQRELYDEKFLEIRTSGEPVLPPEMEAVLRKNKIAWENFNNLAPGYRKQYVGWLASAKRPETRERRLEEAIRLLEKNRKLGMK